MKQIALLFAGVVILACTSSDANAQRLFGRIFRSQPAVTYNSHARTNYGYAPVARSYNYSQRSTRKPVPITGYGANIHRNYMIRRAQKKAAATGIPPRNRGNIIWAR